MTCDNLVKIASLVMQIFQSNHAGKNEVIKNSVQQELAGEQ